LTPNKLRGAPSQNRTGREWMAYVGGPLRKKKEKGRGKQKPLGQGPVAGRNTSARPFRRVLTSGLGVTYGM